MDSFVSGGVCDRAHAYKAQDCSGGGRSAVLRTGGTGDRIPWKPHHAFGTGTARGSGAVCLGDDFSDDEAFLRVDGRFDWRDGGRRGAADGGYGVGGGGQPGRELLTGMSGTLLQQVSGIAVNIPGMCFKLLLAVISTVFMELDFPQIMRFLEKIIPEKWKETVLAVKKGTFGTMGKCAAAYVFIFLMTFAELAAGLLLLRIEGAFAIAFLIAVLDILPVLGTGTVLLPWAVIAFAGGNARMGIGVIGLYLIITVVRNIVEPKLVGKQMGLSPVVMLPCMIVGLHFFGILGLFGVPLLASFLKKTLQ